MRRHVFLPLMLLLAGCAAQQARWNYQRARDTRTRAAFDLECPADKLELVPLGTAPVEDWLVVSYGVRGCGRQATYVLVPPTRFGVPILNAIDGHAVAPK